MIQTKSNIESFKPVWWAWNTHIHTIVASKCTPVQKPGATRLEISTPDGDFLEIDVCKEEGDKPVVALFHGLEGSTERFYIANLMTKLKARGYSSVALNFRTCGSRMNDRPRFYHSGETDDYRTLLHWISLNFPGQEIYAVGFSLGGNALVKYLGEEGMQSKVSRAIAVSPPFDLKEGSLQMHQGFNRIYEHYFLKTLRKKLKLKRHQFPEIPEFTGNSLYAFDDQVTAKVHGFKDADDYYEQCSSKYYYQSVKKDLLVIHSEQDPLCPFEFAPVKIMEEHPLIETCFLKEGGHVGFLSQDKGWLNRVLLQWLLPDERG